MIALSCGLCTRESDELFPTLRIHKNIKSEPSYLRVSPEHDVSRLRQSSLLDIGMLIYFRGFNMAGLTKHIV